MATPSDPDELAALLSAAGFIAAPEEAEDLLLAAGEDQARLDRFVTRRLTGEPLAWITGHARFCGLDIKVDPGVYVPRPQSEQLAERAAALLPAGGVTVDLCTGSGAIAKVLMERGGAARVSASDIDERAVACARKNGVDARVGDLFEPLSDELGGSVDVVVSVVPYVPTPDLALLQRDTLEFESSLSYDGGPDGADILRRVVAGSGRYLRRGGSLLLELGGDQVVAIAPDLERHGFEGVTSLTDEDGNLRGVEARLASNGG